MEAVVVTAVAVDEGPAAWEDEVAVAVAEGERAAAAAAIAAAAAGLVAIAVRISGDNVTGLVEVSSGVLGAETAGRPEWSIEFSGTGERARIPAGLGWSGFGLLAMAISCRCER